MPNKIPEFGVPYFVNEINYLYRQRVDRAIKKGDLDAVEVAMSSWRWALDNIHLTSNPQDMLDLVNDLRSEAYEYV